MIRNWLVCMLCIVMLTGLAWGQNRDVYTVDGIDVDETATSVIEAQQNAFAEAKRIGAQILIERLSLAEDRLAIVEEPITPELAGQLAAAVDVEEEVAGAGRYRGKLAVLYNPEAIRDYMRARGLAYTDQQAPHAVLIPVTANSSIDYAWRFSWPKESEGRLVPTLTDRSLKFAPDSAWPDIVEDVRAYGMGRAIMAELLGEPGFYQVRLHSVTPAGRREIGLTSTLKTLKSAVWAAQELLDTEWKQASIIRDNALTLATATLLYTSLPEWNTVRAELARSPMVSNIQTRAISADGAVVDFAYAGEGARLRADLRERGLVLSQEAIGWVIKSAATE